LKTSTSRVTDLKFITIVCSKEALLSEALGTYFFSLEVKEKNSLTSRGLDDHTIL
jgi:hypothetical protein